MIKHLKTVLLALLLLLPALSNAANRMSRVYMYGFACSFNDSTVAFTSIQGVDSCYLQSRTGFLVSRDNYSYQLRDYLKSKGVTDATCIVVFSPKRKKVEKRYAKMLKRYEHPKKGNFIVKKISNADFKFSGIEPYDSVVASGGKAKGKKAKQK